MSRKLLYILPIVLPFLLYGLYAWWAKRKALRAGIEDGGEEVQGIWHDAPWAWLGIVALLLFIATLIATALTVPTFRPMLSMARSYRVRLSNPRTRSA